MAERMTEDEWRAFVSHGTRTGKLATTRKDGSPHVAPVWFILDGSDLVFTTGADTLKGRSLRRTGRAAMCVDDEQPPFSFVTVEGTATISDDLDAMLPASISIAARYMGPEQAEAFGRRNAVSGELLVRLTPTNVVAMARVSD
ncbi:MAG: PPOX class F420-dependent oxidoreductase [Actinomycetota bacterium]